MHLSSASHLILLSSLLLLLSASTSGQTENENQFETFDPKPVTCCKELQTTEPKVKITKCYILPGTEKCLASVVFIDTIDNMYCINPKAPWLQARIKRLEKNGVTCKAYTKPSDLLY